MKLIFFLLGALLLAPLVSASECTAKCTADYNASVAEASIVANSKLYEWGWTTVYPPSHRCYFRAEGYSTSDDKTTDPCGKIHAECFTTCTDTGIHYKACWDECLSAGFYQCCKETRIILADRALKSCLAACPPETLPEQPPATPPPSPPPSGLNNTPPEPPVNPPAEVDTNDSNTTEQPPAQPPVQPPASEPGSNKKEPSVSLPKIPGCSMPTGLLLFALLGVFFGTAFRGTSRNL